MTYDDPSLSEFRGYFEAKEPGKRERAEAWATAIGLQKVDGLSVSRYLVETAKAHIEGRITQAQARRRIHDYYEAKDELKSRYLLIGIDRPPPRFEDGDVSRVVRKSGKKKNEGCQKKVVRKGCQKTVDRLVDLLKAQPHLTQVGMSAALGISRQAIQKHIANLKSAGRLRRIGPDKGGHWEVKQH